MKKSELRQIIREEISNILNKPKTNLDEIVPVIPPMIYNPNIDPSNKVIFAIYVILMATQGIILGSFIVTALYDAIPAWFRSKIEQYKLNKNSTREEVMNAAKEIYSSLKPGEKAEITKRLKNMDIEDTDRSTRALRTKNLKNYTDRLKQRYGKS